MTNEPDAPKDYRGVGMRASPTLQIKLEEIKSRLDCRTTTEVLRYAIAWLHQCLEAEAVDITKNGQRYRANLPQK